MNNEQTAQVHMSSDLNVMFQKMETSEREKEISLHKKMMEFTQEIGNKQRQLIKKQQQGKSEPPVVDGKWPSPQSVKQANQQFAPFTKFSKEKEAEIDATCQELLQLNDEMMRKLSECFNEKQLNEDS